MDKLDQAIGILRKDPVWNANILNFIEDNPIQYLDIEGESVIVVGEDLHPRGFIASKNADEVKALMQRFPEIITRFSALEEWVLPLVARGREMPHYVPAAQFILPDDVRFDPPRSEIESLRSEDADTVLKYMTFHSDSIESYIADRIANTKTAAIRKDGKLVAWSMLHRDGALGFLSVLPEYRKQGLAHDLTVYLIEKVRERGRVPMVQVQPKSVESKRLGEKMGFVYQKSLVWIDFK